MHTIDAEESRKVLPAIIFSLERVIRAGKPYIKRQHLNETETKMTCFLVVFLYDDRLCMELLRSQVGIPLLETT